MYDTFAADLEKANGEESKFQKAFEDHIAVLEKSTSDLKREIVSKQEESAAKAQALSEAEATLAATMEQKDTDETIFSSTREQCKMKSDEWDERGRLRTEQLSGINKALEILTSDDARDTFQEATGNRVVDNFGSEGVDVDFLQVHQEKDPREKAFLVLKQMSRGTSNLRLARLAAAVRTTATGHFDEVISKIDDMDAKLKQEGLDDVIQRDWCIKEQHFNEDLKSRKEYDISQLEAKILRTEEAKANMLKKQDRTREQLKELQDMWKQAGEDRVAESAEYTNAKNDDTMAISLLADAIAAFSAYGENNAVLLQVNATCIRLIQAFSELERQQHTRYSCIWPDAHSVLRSVADNFLEVSRASKQICRLYLSFYFASSHFGSRPTYLLQASALRAQPLVHKVGTAVRE